MSSNVLKKPEAFAGLLGVTDGILTALTLAAGRTIEPQGNLTLSLAMRVATASALTGGVIFFTVETARRNQQLVHAEKELNLLAHGRLATTHLGHIVLVESSKAAATATVANFLGALSPFLAGLIYRRFVWLPICFAILFLGALGSGIAKATYRSRTLWVSGLMIAGIALAALGIWLRIV